MSIQVSTEQAAKIVLVSKRQVDYWARTGLLRPTGHDATGRGTRRRYTFSDLVALAVIAKLRNLGCPLQKIRAAVAKLREEFRHKSHADALTRQTLLTDGKRVYLYEGDDKVVDVLRKQYVWAVHMGLAIGELKKRVAALPLRWTEAVKVRGQTYQLRVTRDTESGGYVVQCVDLPGAIEQGETPEEAVDAGRQAVEALLNVEERLGLRPVRAGHVRAG